MDAASSSEVKEEGMADLREKPASSDRVETLASRVSSD